MVSLCIPWPVAAQDVADRPKDAEISTVDASSSFENASGSVVRYSVDLAIPGSVGKYPLKVLRAGFGRITMWSVTYSDGGLDEDQNERPDYLTITTPDDESAAFKIESNVYITQPHGSRIVLSRMWQEDAFNTTVTCFELRFPDGGKAFGRFIGWSGSGRIEYLEDPNGLRYTYEYQDSHPGSFNLQRVVDPSGRWIRYHWANFGTSSLPIYRVARVEGSNGDWVQYTWDSAWNLSADFADGTRATITYSQDSTYSYRDYRDPRISKGLPNARFVTRKNIPVYATSEKYRFEGQRWPTAFVLVRIDDLSTGTTVSRRELRLGSDGWYNDDLVTEYRGDGHSRRITSSFCGDAYDDTTSPVIRPTHITDYRGQTWIYNYGQHRASLSAVTDPLGRQTLYAREPLHANITQIRYPDGTSKSWEYSDANAPYFVSRVTDERGHVTTFDRYPNGVVSQANYPDGSTEAWLDLNQYNQPTKHRLRNGAHEWFDYDASGRLITHWLPQYSSTRPTSGDRITYSYYGDGHPWEDRIHTMTDPRGHVTTYEYDRHVSTGAACPGRGLTTKVTHPDGSYASAGYDSYGNKIWEENELRQRTSYEYDEYRRIRRVTNPLGHVTETRYGDNDQEAYAHTFSSPKRVISPSGTVTAFGYDADRHLIAKAEADGTPDVKFWRYEYDEVGNQTKVREQVGGSAGSEVWRDLRFEYDNRNRKIAQLAPLGRNTDWGYDGVGNVVLEVHPDGTRIAKTYDSMNRVSTATDEMNRVTTYLYHASGKVSRIIDPKGNAYKYDYDASDRPTIFWLPSASSSPGSPLWDYEQSTYDAAGNVVTFRNRSGQLKTITYDSRNRERTTSWNDGTTSGTTTDYDVTGRVTHRTNASGNLTYTYDAAGQLLSERQLIHGGPTKTINYEYDADGNRTRVHSN